MRLLFCLKSRPIFIIVDCYVRIYTDPHFHATHVLDFRGVAAALGLVNQQRQNGQEIQWFVGMQTNGLEVHQSTLIAVHAIKL